MASQLEAAAWRAIKWIRDMHADNQREVLEDLCAALGVNPDEGRRFEKGAKLEDHRKIEGGRRDIEAGGG